MFEKLKDFFRGETVEIPSHDPVGSVFSDVYDAVLSDRERGEGPKSLQYLSNVLRRKNVSYSEKRHVVAHLLRQMASE